MTLLLSFFLFLSVRSIGFHHAQPRVDHPLVSFSFPRQGRFLDSKASSIGSGGVDFLGRANFGFRDEEWENLFLHSTPFNQFNQTMTRRRIAPPKSSTPRKRQAPIRRNLTAAIRNAFFSNPELVSRVAKKTQGQAGAAPDYISRMVCRLGIEIYNTIIGYSHLHHTFLPVLQTNGHYVQYLKPPLTTTQTALICST